ncbi:DUF3961 domain-containing protein [Bacillus sp. DX4.1]|nr:DUF3961 domain-containing protein [Bacillus sp. DX4.1]MDM5187858.1 DUF3961 domain-containing protein [Bacillus sp. DX4.1]
MDDYFGLQTTSDRTWFYGFYVLGTLLFAASMFIAYVL